MKFKINKGFIVQKVGDKSTIFDGEESALYTFNRIGSVIFNKIRQGWDKEKIVKFLSKTYVIREETAGKDFDEFTKKLIKSKIIKKA
jgi:hypothetical protein